MAADQFMIGFNNDVLVRDMNILIIVAQKVSKAYGRLHLLASCVSFVSLLTEQYILLL